MRMFKEISRRLAFAQKAIRRLGVLASLSYVRQVLFGKSATLRVKVSTSTEILLRRCSSDRTVFNNIFIYGELGFPVSKAPDVIFDFGAYTGISAVYLSLRFPSARIYAVEPSVENYAILVENTKNLDKVVTINSAIGSVSGFGRISNPDASKYSFQILEPSDSGDVTMVTAVDLMKRCGERSVGLLKVDVEGAEKSLIESLRSSAISPEVLCIEFHEDIVPGITQEFLGAIGGRYRLSRCGEYHVFHKIK